MTLSPMAYTDSLRIGTIDFVSPDKIKVLLDIEAPDGVALNTGTPRSFPRINGYVLIPGEEGYLVAQVEWITIERSQYPKRKGMQDFGLVDLPYPLRKMSLNPLGVLTYENPNASGDEVYHFRRGVESYPTVGDAVVSGGGQKESGQRRPQCPFYSARSQWGIFQYLPGHGRCPSVRSRTKQGCEERY